MIPLAHKIRPHNLSDFIGQEELVGNNGPIRKMIETQNLSSMIFWGSPGSGKTTLAEIIANSVEADFQKISGVIDGKEKLKKVIDKSIQNSLQNRKTILFIDEIHRWNKAQQDALLPYVEKGDIILIGATTENPSFSIISALLSRVRVYVFETPSSMDIEKGINRALAELKVALDDDAKDVLINLSNGDIRFAINSLETASNISLGKPVTKSLLEKAIQKFLRYDKLGEEHYNIISAVHKSLRSSNATAATYWIVRMLEAGEDPLYVARRLVRFASEDIGNANPNALLLANQVYVACQNLGMPECNVHLVQLAEYLAKCPKNNSAYVAAEKAKSDVKNFGNLPVPMNIRNAPTKLMKDLGYGKGYEYDHDLPNKKSDQKLMPDELADRDYFN